MKQSTKRFRSIFYYIICLVLVGVCLFWMSRPALENKAYSTRVFSTQADPVLLDDGRQYGDVNLLKFIELASKKPSTVFNPATDMVRTRDSITFTTSAPSIFFGVDGGAWWKKKYKNLPISFPDDHSFQAAIHVKDSTEYIFIPYQILSCLAASFNEQPQGLKNHSVHTFDDHITLSDVNDIKNLTPNGDKIQTGGIVFQHVADVLQSNGGKNKTNREQLEILWKYAKPNWLYITDPYTGADTWRSATETIEAYYFSQKKGYSGDCDDFAILMASFARQLGFESHIVAAFGEYGGHAYAEFKDGGKWTPMDWFSDKFGGEPYNAIRRVVIDDV